MNLRNYDNWNKRFLEMAKLISSWSKDPSTQVGAVVTDWDNKIVSMGYNGFPAGISDTQERLQDRDLKYKMIIHAEVNALIFANENMINHRIYTYPFMPCPSCASLIIQAGIQTVVSYNNMPERWANNFELSKQLFKEAGVELILYDEHNVVLNV